MPRRRSVTIRAAPKGDTSAGGMIQGEQEQIECGTGSTNVPQMELTWCHLTRSRSGDLEYRLTQYPQRRPMSDVGEP